MNRHREQELRRRVRHLHQELDATGGAMPWDEGSPADEATVEVVREALRRRGVDADGAGAGYALRAAVSLAMRAPDPSITVRAEFATDRITLLGLPAASALCQAPEPTWRGGLPVGTGARVFDTHDLDSLRRTRRDIAEAIGAGRDVIPSTWCPSSSQLVWHADAVRPPAEALALAAVLLRESGAEPENVLAVDLGHDGASQALSAMVPLATIHTAGTTYGPRRAPDRTHFDAVVVNFPSEATRRWATLVGDPDLVRNAPRLRTLRDGGHRVDPREGVEEVLALGIPALTKGHRVALVVLGDSTPDRHHKAVALVRERLVGRGFELEPHPTTAKRPTYVQAPTRRAAWTPSGARPVTGRVVSAWTVHP